MERFVFLSDQFYNDYPSDIFPQIEQKANRPYIQIVIRINDKIWVAPLRSNINHPYVLWTDRQNKCGVDISKCVPIIKNSYINHNVHPHIRQNEFEALRGKDYKIKTKFLSYIEKYKSALDNPDERFNKILIHNSTLQYFHTELGIN